MKTFKLVGLSVIDEEMRRQDIPFIDGLIINKEDGQNRWLVEAYLDDDYEPMFASLKEQPEFQLQVTITILAMTRRTCLSPSDRSQK